MFCVGQESLENTLTTVLFCCKSILHVGYNAEDVIRSLDGLVVIVMAPVAIGIRVIALALFAVDEEWPSFDLGKHFA